MSSPFQATTNLEKALARTSMVDGEATVEAPPKKLQRLMKPEELSYLKLDQTIKVKKANRPSDHALANALEKYPPLISEKGLFIEVFESATTKAIENPVQSALVSISHAKVARTKFEGNVDMINQAVDEDLQNIQNLAKQMIASGSKGNKNSTGTDLSFFNGVSGLTFFCFM